MAERFNVQIRRARDAFLDGDESSFEVTARACLALLDKQVRLLASWPPYRLDRKIERAKARHGDDAERAVKHFHIWVTYQEELESEPLRDYYRMDLDGLVAACYRPRVAAFLDLLRKKMGRGITEVSEGELDPIYTEIERAFIAEPVNPQPGNEDPVFVVQSLLKSG